MHALYLISLYMQKPFSTILSLASRLCTVKGSSFQCRVESKQATAKYRFFECHNWFHKNYLPLYGFCVICTALLMVALWEDVAIVESNWWLICPRAQMRVTLGSWPFGVDRLEHTFHPSRLIMTFYLWVLHASCVTSTAVVLFWSGCGCMWSHGINTCMH